MHSAIIVHRFRSTYHGCQLGVSERINAFPTNTMGQIPFIHESIIKLRKTDHQNMIL